jgi:hypothetical protein
MTYYRYKEPEAHEETCCFEQWDRAAGRMGHCGEKAAGQRGSGESRIPLCEDHLNYAVACAGRPVVYKL